MATIYRGYDIEPHTSGGFTWRDDVDAEQFIDGEAGTTYPTEEAAMDAIDARRKLIRELAAKASA